MQLKICCYNLLKILCHILLSKLLQQPIFFSVKNLKITNNRARNLAHALQDDQCENGEFFYRRRYEV